MNFNIKYFIFLIVYCCSFGTLFSQHSFEFGIDTDEYCDIMNADTDADGNVIMVGFIGSPTIDDKDAYILTVYSDGSYNEKRFALTDTIGVFSNIKVLENGNYFISGTMNADSTHDFRNELWVVILDPEYNILINKAYAIDEAYSYLAYLAKISFDNSGNIIITTSVIEKESESKTQFTDFVFYKLNQSGDTLMSRYYSYIFDEYPFELVRMPNSDNLMIIERSINIYNRHELMFIDPDLNILKVNQFEATELSLRLSGTFSTNYWVTDTTFIMVANNHFDMGFYNEKYFGVYLFDTSAVIHQELVFNKNDTTDMMAKTNSMAYVDDTTIYIGGFQSLPFSPWNLDPTIIELYLIDNNMNLLGYKELGGDVNYQLSGLVPTKDGGCLLYGSTNTNPHEYELDVHIWKVLRDDINIITNVEDIPLVIEKLEVFPNPVEDILIIRLP